VIRSFGLAALTAAALLAAAPAEGQQGACPPVEAGSAPPVEIRVGDRLLRAQVTRESGDSEGRRVEVRLVGCERAGDDADLLGVAEEEGGAEAVEELAGAASTLLRVLHDLRVGLELAPGQDGRCVRASVDVVDAAAGAGGVSPEPVAVELCGLPVRAGGGGGTR
jgi:hypothetical protein